MRAAAIPFLGQIAQGVDVAKILSAIDIGDHCGVERRRIWVIPEKELLTVALEGDFDEVRHTLLRPRAESEELLSAAAHQLFRTHLAELLQVAVDRRLKRFRRGLMIGVRSALRFRNYLVDHLELQQLW